VIFLDVPFGEILGESIGVWEARNQVFLILRNLLIRHVHQIFDLCLKVNLDLIEWIDFLLNLTVLQIAVDIACGNVRKHFQLWAQFRKVKHPFRAEIVDQKSLLKRVVKVDGGSAVQNNFHLIYYGVLVFLAQPQLFDHEVSLNRKNFAPSIVLELLFAAMNFPQPLEAFRVQNFLFDPRHGINVLLWSDHDINLFDARA
jgi:hypothetical protein